MNLKQITKELEHDILYPSKELAERFLDVKISHDLGTSGEIPIIGLPTNTISDLWPQANYSAYYNKDLVIGFQNKLSKRNIIKKYDINETIDVITRTMDEPFF